MKKIACIVAVLMSLGLAARPVAAADEPKPDLRAADSVKALLDGAVSRPVTLMLTSGHEISGTVSKVGERVVYLTKLTGRDYYDAAVLIDRVEAVILRVWGK